MHTPSKNFLINEKGDSYFWDWTWSDFVLFEPNFNTYDQSYF